MNHVRSIVRVDKAHQCGIYGQGVGIAIVRRPAKSPDSL